MTGHSEKLDSQLSLKEQETTMPVINYQDTEVSIANGESVLEALEGANFSIPFSCRAGVCHSCMLQTEDAIPEQAQNGLTANQIAQGYFLACSCYPEKSITVKNKDESDLVVGTIVDKKMLNDTVLGLRIQVDFRWFPGQYLSVWYSPSSSGGQAEVSIPRSYSIASRCEAEKIVELHIKRHEQGLVSRWLVDDTSVGDTINLSSPLGNCFYTDEHAQKPLLMACTGTGLAPLYGILLEALAKNHSAPIYLYAAGGDPSHLYYQEELEQLAQKYDNFTYVKAVRRNATQGIIEQDVVELVKEKHPELNGWKIFLCGSPAMIKTLQRNCFFSGAAVSDILVDAFEMAVPATDK